MAEEAKREADLAAAYRKARKAFIAASGGDTISRVHPAKGPDGKPLFCDHAAYGPRDAARALLLIGGPLAALLKNGLAPPSDTRLVVVHALDPYAQAWGKSGVPADWPQKSLADIAAEDFKKVTALTVLDMDGAGSPAALTDVLAAALPRAKITVQTAPSDDAEAAIKAAFAALRAFGL